MDLGNGGMENEYAVLHIHYNLNTSVECFNFEPTQSFEIKIKHPLGFFTSFSSYKTTVWQIDTEAKTQYCVSY